MKIEPYYKTKNCALFQCDNLELFRDLSDNSIDLIYCDILYNTRRKFQDYDDNLGTPQEAIEWYEPRLEHMKKILKETGSIYIHCDWRLVHYLKIKMDEIFGLNNFKNEIIWEYNTGGNTNKYYSRKHDNILFYVYSNNYTFNIQKEKVYVPSLANRHSVVKKLGLFQDENNQWCRMANCKDVWKINTLFRNNQERIGYDNQKPKELLERIIKVSSNKNDVIADFFMGSGTTGEVALELNRKFIGCDIEDKACQISKKRLEKIKTIDQ